MSDEPRPFGPFVLLKPLGRGAMGDVHLARPYNPNRGIPTPMVVKRLHGELATKGTFVSRFRHEATIAVSVDSPNVAKVYDVGAVGETLYIAMEYVEGWPLAKVMDEILKSGRHASVASVVDFIAGGLEGLHALHTARDPETQKPLGIVHRDVSPKNLMVGEDGSPRLIDLGLGKSNAQDWKTRTGVVMGSVGYMPPEQAAGDHVDARADVYAMGVVAYEMLALRNFIRRGSVPAMMEQSMNPKFTPPSEYRRDVPRALDEVIRHAVRPKKEERFQSAKEFLDALRQAVPATHTEGGMVSLVEELFGASRLERRREMEALLRLPLPLEAPVDHEPTKVFVRREGVAMPDDRHLAPTHVLKEQIVFMADGPTVPPTVATEISDISQRPPHQEAPRSSRPPGSKKPLSMSATPPGSVPGLRGPRGVPVGVVVAAVFIAALVGAAVAVTVTQSMQSAQNVVSVPVGVAQDPSPEVVAVHPRGASPEAGSGPGRMYGGAQDVRREAAAEADPPAHEEGAELVSKSTKRVRSEPKPQRAIHHEGAQDVRGEPRGASPEAGSGPGRMYGGAQDVRGEPRGASPEAGSGPGRMYGGAQDVRGEPEKEAPPPDSKAAIDARFASLVRQVDARIARLPEGTEKDKLLGFKAKVRMNSSSQDLQILRQNLAVLERELEAIK